MHWQHTVGRRVARGGDMDECPPVTVLGKFFRYAKINIMALQRLHHFYDTDLCAASVSTEDKSHKNIALCLSVYRPTDV